MTKRMRLPAGALIAIAALATAGMAWAADPRLDAATDNLVKAKALVAAAQPSGNVAAYNQHAMAAQNLIDQAMQRIALAKAAANAPPPIPPGARTTGPTMTNPSGLIQLNPQPEPPSRPK